MEHFFYTESNGSDVRGSWNSEIYQNWPIFQSISVPLALSNIKSGSIGIKKAESVGRGGSLGSAGSVGSRGAKIASFRGIGGLLEYFSCHFLYCRASLSKNFYKGKDTFRGSIEALKVSPENRLEGELIDKKWVISSSVKYL